MLIIFDLDKTLYNSDGLFLERENLITKKIADFLKIPPTEARKKYLEKRKETGSSTETIVSFGIGRNVFFDVLRESHPENHITYDEKLFGVIEILSKENTMVIASNSPSDIVEKILGLLEIRKFFKKIYGAEYFEKSKPNTKIFDIILDEMGFKPENAVMVGDSLKKDILPAKSKGLKGILVGAISNEADASIEKIYDLPASIDRL